ncbi:MAG TPA: glycosyltransferase [Jatrophihabitantaceae bacterium]|jgi:GT2 family glycosyltransferase
MALFQARTPDEARNLLPANGQPVVIVPVYNSYDDVVQCYRAFFRNTPEDVPLLVVDDGGWDRRTANILTEVFSGADLAHDVVLLKQPSNKGFVLTMNDAFVAADRADVVILNSDVIVGPGWLERLRAAAYSSATIATASALTNYGTIVSVGEGKVVTDSVPGGLSPDDAALRVAHGSPRLRPRIPTAVGHCTYIKRALFDIVGLFDPVFSPGYGEEVDLSQRAIGAGFEHVAADDVFVFHRGGGSFGRSPEVERRRHEHEQINENRYPYYGHWVRRAFADENSPLAAALLAARRSLLGLRVAIDGMCLGPLQAGTQIGVLETTRALAARHDISELILYVPVEVPAYVTEAVRGLAKVRLVPTPGFEPIHVKKAHVVYRAYQIREKLEIDWLKSVAERVVVNWLDLIAYNDPVYFAEDDAWRQYRDLAKLTTYTVDGLAFISDHSRRAAEIEGLLLAGTPSRIVYNGTEHTASSKAPAQAPAGAAHLQPGFLLCLGVSYLHKNRLFALRLLAQLHKLGWTGSLVLAGANPPYGSSLTQEAEFLLKRPELAEHVVSIGAFSEGEKSWLYENSGLVLYPTTSEGFGLIPFEAAHYGAPCLSSRMASLDEVLGPDVPGFDSFDEIEVARTALTLLADEGAAQKLVAQVLERSRDFTWAGVADEVVTLLTEVTGRPPSRVVAIRGEDGYTARSDIRGLGDKSRTYQVFDSAVRWIISHPELRQKLVPPGSSRQQYVRKSIDRIKTRL